MLCKTGDYIKNHQLFSKTDKILVAVSGGIDSVVLLHVLCSLGYDCSVAHCNFHLRGSESDRDFDFVKNLAEKYKSPIFFTHFVTQKVAENQRISIEMAARELRYAWFQQLIDEQNFACVAVAHHANDSAETFFINLTRGTGIHGLTGIKPKQNSIVRPLLWAKRSEIEAFAMQNKLTFVNDSTNSDTIFRRNAIRHKILPELQKLNPAFLENMQRTMRYLADTEAVFEEFCCAARHEICSQNGEILQISIQKLLQKTAPKTLLYELISPYGFNSEVSEQIFESLSGNSGKIFCSKTHQLLKDRDFLFVEPLQVVENKVFTIEKDTREIFSPIHLRFSCEEKVVKKTVSEAFLDFDKLSFPLELRLWKNGDTFTPFGMRNKKKISDFLIDNKIPITQKNKTWVLTSQGKIVWLVGLRIDDAYKITPETQKILHIVAL